MEIINLLAQRHEGQSWTLSAEVDSTRIYFTYDGIEMPDSIIGDPFVIAALIPSMRRKETLLVDNSVPVSQQLLENLKQYQEIYRHWYPRIDEVEIDAENIIDHKVAGQHSGSFFSGGVDSIYTVSKSLEKLDYLLLCRGLDIPIKEQKRWDKTHTLAKKFAENVGLKLITITTNAKDQLLCPDIDNHGAILVSNGIGLGLERLFVPGSNAWDELFIWGSHPLTDPLLGNGKTSVVHHGNVYRTEKTREIVRFRHGLEDLRVCNVYSDYNCGKCEKCLRTMTCLAILGEESSALPPLHSIELIRNLRLEKKDQFASWQDNHRLAVNAQNSYFADAIAHMLKRYQKRELLKECDRVFLNERLVGLKRRFI